VIARAGASLLLFVDLQDTLLRRLEPGVRRDVVEAALALHHGAVALGVPAVVAELDPRSYGRALPQLATLPIRERTRLSASEPIGEVLGAKQRTSVVIAGVERHGAVALTAIELHDAGFDVRVVVDATASRSTIDGAIALDRLRVEGVRLVTAEAALLEWADDVRSPVAVDLLRSRR
jgi:nicotinamidase-related amidase